MELIIDKAELKDGKIIIELDLEQIQNITNNKVNLHDLEPGDEFKIGNGDIFIVLEHTNDGTMVITKEPVYSNIEFGTCDNWKYSTIRTKLLGQDYYQKICKIIGRDNINPMIRDLTSMDGLADYYACTDVVSLLTAAEYAKYHKILGKNCVYLNHWWTVTPTTTIENINVCCIDNHGILDWTDCESRGDVYPVLKLTSDILVIPVEK